MNVKIAAASAALALCAAQLSLAEPLGETYDVVVVGGTSYGIAAATAAQEAGAKVFVAAPRGYLGEDLAGKYILVPEDGDDASHPMYAKLWAEGGKVQKPLAIKKLFNNKRRA